jgi:hypothetical protein
LKRDARDIKTGLRPTATGSAERLSELKTMHERGLITDEEYEAKRRQILDRKWRPTFGARAMKVPSLLLRMFEGPCLQKMPISCGMSHLSTEGSTSHIGDVVHAERPQRPRD